MDLLRFIRKIPAAPDDSQDYGPAAYITWLALAGALTVMILHAVIGFAGLRNACTLEYAHLAGRIAGGHGFTTTVLRPAELSRHDDLAAVPETRRAPLYPAMLAGMMRITRTENLTASAGERRFRPETHAVVPFSLICLIAALALIALTDRINNQREEACLAILITALLPSFREAICISGPMVLATATVTALIPLSLLASRNPGKPLWAALLGLTAAAALLTSAATLPAVIAAGILTVWNRPDEQHRKHMFTALTVFILPLVLWGWRNHLAAGSLFGTAPYNWADGSIYYPAGLLDRSLEDIWRAHRALHGMMQKGIVGMTEYFTATSDSIPWLILLCIGAACARLSSEQLRTTLCLAGGYLLSAFWMAASAGEETHYSLVIWMPLLVLGGINSLRKLTEYPAAMPADIKQFLTAGLLGTTIIFTIFQWRFSRPQGGYPPYHPALQATAAGLIPANGIICTDIPWAVAWYTGRTTILAPRSPQDLTEIEQHIPVAGVYLTQETARRFLSGTSAFRWHSTWLPVWNGTAPEGWAWHHGIHLPPGTQDQVVLLKGPEEDT